MFELDPLLACGVMLVWTLCWRAASWIVDEIVSWKHHLMLAEVIKCWHRRELNKKMKAKGGTVRMCNIRPDILEVFAITRLDRLFDIKKDEEEALADF